MNDAEIHHAIRALIPWMQKLLAGAMSEQATLQDLKTPAAIGAYHTLRKATVIIIRDGTVTLNPRFVTPDRKHVRYGHMQFALDGSGNMTF